MDKVYTCFQTKTAQKTPPLGAAHTYMAYLREYPSPPGGQGLEGGVLIPHSHFLRRRHPEKRFLSQPHIGAQILANPASPGS